MEGVDDIFDVVLQYEMQNNLQDVAAPDELEDIQLSPEELLFLEKEANKLPPVPEGKIVSPSMVNFARTVTKAYRLCFFQFMQYVDNTDGLCPDVLGYCTRDNIDHFFLNWISKRTTSPAVNRRFVSAIQKYSDFWEDRPGFKVESALVKKGLDDAKVCKKRVHSQFSVHVDAHKHRPTLHHSPEQEMRMIQDALTNYAPSKYGFLPLGINFLICWNCSMQGFTRGDEVRNCRLPDLCHESNYGPWRLSEQGISAVRSESTPHGVLSIIQQPFNTKIMSSIAHVIGFFRHKDWRRCATSVIAFSIMARFEAMTATQMDTFFALGENQVPNWYKYYLIDWRDYDSMADTFRKYFERSGVAYTKLTHTRKLGIIRAHQMGADRENIILLSKHTTHRVDTSYLPELPYQAMLATSGFDVFRREEYYIPRSYAKVPLGWSQKIFPYLNTWRDQVNDLWGYDKGLAAKNFVNFLLPFLAEVVLQDGIYFTADFPDHPYSKILLQKMSADGYDQWASETREAILEREAIIRENTSEDRKYEAMLRTTEHTVRRVIDLEQRIDSLRAEFKLEFVNLKNMLFQSEQHPVDHNRISHIAPSLPAHAITPINLNASTFRSRFDVSPIPTIARSPIETNVIATITDNFPSTPNIPPCIHKTVKENMEYWMTHKYWQYLNRNNTSLQKLGWDKNTQHRFCKRRDIAMWVKTVAEKKIHANLRWENDTDIFIQVSTDLDDERGDKTVTNALREFKNESEQSWIIKRTSRRNK